MFGFLKNYFGPARNDDLMDPRRLGAMEGFDLALAIVAHQNLCQRILASAQGSSKVVFSALALYNDERSELGLWLYGRGRDQLGRQPGFTALLGHHQMFHRTAAQLALLPRTALDAGIRQRRMAQLERFSRAVVLGLEQLRENAQPGAGRRSA